MLPDEQGEKGVALKAEKILLIALLAVTAGAIVFAEVGVPVYFGPHTITFNGKTYDPVADRSTWSYTVTSSTSPTISHWVLELCLPTHVVTTASPSGYETTYPDGDPTTGVIGIKWDEPGFDTNLTIDFSVTLVGDWEVEPVDAGIKAGGDIYRGTIDGPSCTPFTLDLTVSGLTDLTITQPKLEQWFGGTCQSLGTLTVTVEASTDYQVTAYYTVTPTPTPAFTGDPLRFEYPASGGTWTVLPEWPGSIPLPGFSGSSNTPSGETIAYPVQINLKNLGDREGGETFTFTIHVVLSEL